MPSIRSRLESDVCSAIYGCRGVPVVRGLRRGEGLTPGDAELFRSALLHRMALLDHARGWAQQFHLGALRNTEHENAGALGPDTGYDAIGDFPQAIALARFLDRLDDGRSWPRRSSTT